jgi:hypothetical protein
VTFDAVLAAHEPADSTSPTSTPASSVPEGFTVHFDMAALRRVRRVPTLSETHRGGKRRTAYSDEKVANRNGRDFGWRGVCWLAGRVDTTRPTGNLTRGMPSAAVERERGREGTSADTPPPPCPRQRLEEDRAREEAAAAAAGKARLAPADRVTARFTAASLQHGAAGTCLEQSQ